MNTKMAQTKASAAQNKTPREVTKNFENLLDETSNNLTSQEKSALQAVQIMHNAQLQMLNSLFADDDTEQDFPLLQQEESFSPYSLYASNSSQNIDKYRIAQTAPSLLSTEQPDDKTTIDQLISQVAKRYSLSEDLIHSVVTVESAYNSQAISPVGAQGLMQLMPATAEELGVNNSLDPAENLNGGSRYLKQLLEKYDGDLDHALAAYNWGQGNVDRRGLNNMPEETRNYLSKIKGMLDQG
jgi:soluble lytic murein transglycosylase-like protein